MRVLEQVVECSAQEIGGGIGHPDGFHAGLLTGDNSKTRDRQIKRLGQQAETGVVGLSFHRRRVHSKPQNTVNLSVNRFTGCLRLQADTKGGSRALLPNQNHWLRFQAISWREGINHRWTNWSARIAMMGEISMPNRHIGISC